MQELTPLIISSGDHSFDISNVRQRDWQLYAAANTYISFEEREKNFITLSDGLAQDKRVLWDIANSLDDKNLKHQLQQRLTDLEYALISIKSALDEDKVQLAEYMQKQNFELQIEKVKNLLTEYKALVGEVAAAVDPKVFMKKRTELEMEIRANEARLAGPSALRKWGGRFLLALVAAGLIALAIITVGPALAAAAAAVGNFIVGGGLGSALGTAFNAIVGGVSGLLTGFGVGQTLASGIGGFAGGFLITVGVILAPIAIGYGIARAAGSEPVRNFFAKVDGRPSVMERSMDFLKSGDERFHLPGSLERGNAALTEAGFAVNAIEDDLIEARIQRLEAAIKDSSVPDSEFIVDYNRLCVDLEKQSMFIQEFKNPLSKSGKLNEADQDQGRFRDGEQQAALAVLRSCIKSLPNLDEAARNAHLTEGELEESQASFMSGSEERFGRSYGGFTDSRVSSQGGAQSGRDTQNVDDPKATTNKRKRDADTPEGFRNPFANP